MKPTEVKIAVPRQPAAAGDRVELRCLATGARPFAQVTWFKGGQRLTQVEDFVSTATNSTVSSVSFIVAAEDNGRNVTCRADNPHLPKSEVSDTVLLNVHCEFEKCSVCHSKESSTSSLFCRRGNNDSRQRIE